MKRNTLFAALAFVMTANAGVALAQDGDGTRVDERVDRRQYAAENYDGTRTDDRVERRTDRRETMVESDADLATDGVDRRTDRREVRRDARAD